MDFEKHQVLYAQEVSEKIEDIYEHILTFTMSEQSARNAVLKIIKSVDDLQIFPERGFDADERVGTQLKPPYKTRGIVAGDYIAFYQILLVQESDALPVVFVSHLISTKSDWVNYFGKS